MKKVLLTGASGFIGRQAVPFLVDHDYEVHCVTSRAEGRAGRDVTWHRADLLNERECRDLFKNVRPTHLLHFAWHTEPGKYWSSEENWKWLKASLDMLHYFKHYGGERATLAGTCAEYDMNYGLCSEDTTPIRSDTVYGKCKGLLSRDAGSYCSKNDLSFAWGRIFFLYGPGEHPSRLVPSVIRNLLKGEEAPCTDGSQRRDYLYSGDVASAFVSLMDGSVRGAVNIASGTAVTVREIVEKIAKKTGNSCSLRLGSVPRQPGDPPLIVADTRRLNEEVGWKPAYSLDEGLDLTIKCLREELT
jgi:nucleoside-diphosphate-sugar epimerase